MESEELEALYAGWPTEKLVEAAMLRSDEYAATAVAAMLRVLERRGVSRDEADTIAAGLQSGHTDERQLDGIGGWLLVLIVWGAVSSTFEIVSGLLLLIGSDDWLSVVDSTLVLGISVYGGYCVSGLAKGRYDAPAHARRWLFGLAAVGVLRGVLQYTLSGEIPPGSGKPILFAAIWLTYLARSRRVARVYRLADAEDAST